MADNFAKSRINASMLASFQGRTVCLLGMAKNVDSNGTSFTLTTSDGRDVKVIMQEPLNEYVNGLTEVTGEVNQQNAILCQHYITFSQECSDTFDIQLYNTAVELAGGLQQHYVVGVNQQDS